MAPATAPVQSLLSYRDDKRRILAAAAAAAREAGRTGNYRQLVTSLSILQLLMARRVLESVEAELAEMGVEAPAVAEVIAEAFAGVSQLGIPLADRLDFAIGAPGDTAANVLRAVLTEVQDTDRITTGTALVVRPTLEGYVRYLNPPSCARCAILAGRVYRWSEGFLRHDNCDCGMIPIESVDEIPDWAITDPMEAFREGQITDLSKADTAAVNEGADLSRVVNVRRKQAGLVTADGLALERGGRLTPGGIYRLASDRSEAIKLLLESGYIR